MSIFWNNSSVLCSLVLGRTYLKFDLTKQAGVKRKKGDNSRATIITKEVSKKLSIINNLAITKTKKVELNL